MKLLDVPKNTKIRILEDPLIPIASTPGPTRPNVFINKYLRKMKLHDVPKNTWVKVDGKDIFFWHLDSPFGICSYDDKELDYEKSFLVYGSTDVEIINKESDGA